MQPERPETVVTSALASHTPALPRSSPKIVSLTMKPLNLWPEGRGRWGIINSSGLGITFQGGCENVQFLLTSLSSMGFTSGVHVAFTPPSLKTGGVGCLRALIKHVFTEHLLRSPR